MGLFTIAHAWESWQLENDVGLRVDLNLGQHDVFLGRETAEEGTSRYLRRLSGLLDGGVGMAPLAPFWGMVLANYLNCFACVPVFLVSMRPR
jgi:hypothetical protein